MSKKVTMPNPKSDKGQVGYKVGVHILQFLVFGNYHKDQKFPKTVKRRSGMEIPVMTKGNASIYRKKER